MSERLAILAEGLFESHHGKTAHGVIRYGAREVAAVIDSSCAGRTASEVIPFCARPVPIVASLGEALRHDPTTPLLGGAHGRQRTSPGGSLLLEALGAGLDVEAGLHHQLADDAELREAAAANGAGLHDLRAVPRDSGCCAGPNSRDPSVRVIHSVGSDTVIGKKVVSRSSSTSRRAGAGCARSTYRPVKPGWRSRGWGIAVDHVISDYVAGAAERPLTRR